jgi:hypothetical protein
MSRKEPAHGCHTPVPPATPHPDQRFQGTLSHSLTTLEAKGLVTITRTPGGQAEAVDLTAQGRQVIEPLLGSGA